MAVEMQRAEPLAPLVEAAIKLGLPYEASPTGRWIRIAGEAGVAYIVQDAWGDGCLLMAIDGGLERWTEHFRRADQAVTAAARVAGFTPAETPSSNDRLLAEAS